MAEKTEAKQPNNSLPLNRIRQIMKSSPEVSLVSTEAVYLVRQATELFIKMMSEKSFDKQKKSLEYKHLASFVEKKENLDFLMPILPQKITVRKYREIMEKEKRKESLGSDEDSSSSEGSDEEEEEEEAEEEESGDENSSDSESVQVIESDKEEEESTKKRKSDQDSVVIELSSEESSESLKASKKSK